MPEFPIVDLTKDLDGDPALAELTPDQQRRARCAAIAAGLLRGSRAPGLFSAAQPVSAHDIACLADYLERGLDPEDEGWPLPLPGPDGPVPDDGSVPEDPFPDPGPMPPYVPDEDAIVDENGDELERGEDGLLYVEARTLREGDRTPDFEVDSRMPADDVTGTVNVLDTVGHVRHFEPDELVGLVERGPEPEPRDG